MLIFDLLHIINYHKSLEQKAHFWCPTTGIHWDFSNDLDMMLETVMSANCLFVVSWLEHKAWILHLFAVPTELSLDRILSMAGANSFPLQVLDRRHLYLHQLRNNNAKVKSFELSLAKPAVGSMRKRMKLPSCALYKACQCLLVAKHYLRLWPVTKKTVSNSQGGWSTWFAEFKRWTNCWTWKQVKPLQKSSGRGDSIW